MADGGTRFSRRKRGKRLVAHVTGEIPEGPFSISVYSAGSARYITPVGYFTDRRRRV